MGKPYTLKTPCADCPFRCDVNRYLAPERAQEIMNESYEDSNFYCHKTVDYSGDSEGDIVNKSRVCAGYLLTMENEGRANQPTRIAERLGLYDRAQLDPEAPVYDSMQDWVRSYSPASNNGERDDLEHCSVASPRCEDPAGFARGGEVFGNTNPPTCSSVCLACDAEVCAGCTDHMETVAINNEEMTLPVCVYCA